MNRLFLIAFACVLGVLSSVSAAEHDKNTANPMRLGIYSGFGHLHGDLKSTSNIPVNPVVSFVGASESVVRSIRPLLGFILGYDHDLKKGFFLGGEFDLGFNFFCVEDAFSNVPGGNDFIHRVKYQGYLIASLVLGYYLNENWDARVKIGLSTHNLLVEVINTTDDLLRAARVFNIGFVPALEVNYHIDDSKAIALTFAFDLQRQFETNVLDTVAGGLPTTTNVVDLNTKHFYAKVAFLFKF